MADLPDHLILTADYEVFGDGSGDVSACVVEPTEAMLSVAARHGAPVTLFVESLEFDAMRRAATMRSGLADGIAAVEKQIRQALRDGNDTQLHLHPQWMGAQPVGDRAWELDFRRWRIGDLNSDEVRKTIKRGLSALEELQGAATESPRVAFRAGAWCIQPSAHVMTALGDSGLAIDSSVAPGLFHSAHGDWYDFRAAPADHACWRQNDDVCQPAASGIWEVPIATAKISWLRHIRAKATARLFDRGGGAAAGCSGGHAGPNTGREKLKGHLARIISAGRAMLDFSTLDGPTLIAVAEGWRNGRRADGVPLPIVAIAHSKNFTRRSASSLDTFLEWAEGQPGLRFSTFPRWLEEAGGPGGAD